MAAISTMLRTLRRSSEPCPFRQRVIRPQLSTPCEPKMTGNDDFRIRPGRIRSTRAARTKPFLAQALEAAQKAGGLPRNGQRRGSTFGRGRAASLAASRLLGSRARGVIVKARVVRQMRSPGALRAHIGYLQRDGVTRDDSPGKLFDAAGDEADGRAFAERCKDDRHHFRFIVSPDDAGELENLRTFTRELMDQASRDLGTRLDWVAIDHWNTEHPHVQILVRGRADDAKTSSSAGIIFQRAFVPAPAISSPANSARDLNSKPAKALRRRRRPNAGPGSIGCLPGKR